MRNKNVKIRNTSFFNARIELMSKKLTTLKMPKLLITAPSK